MRLRLDKNRLLPRYLVLLCQGSRAIHDYLSNSNHGVTRPGINTQQLLGLPVALPPVLEQQNIVRRVEEIDAACNEVAGEVVSAQYRAQLLRSSILADAFSGKLVSHDPADEPASALLYRIAVERGTSKGHRHRAKRARRVGAWT